MFCSGTSTMRTALPLLLLLASCGEPTPTSPSPAPTAPPAAPPPTAPTPAPPAPTPIVSLLDSVPTDLATSSAYHDQPEQLAGLIDGDLETAWNSRTGDLAGAWIEVRVPEGATVTSIELTAGFTHTDHAGTDLFTGNHRVTRVRVLRDGTEVASAPLDPERRDLQSVAVEGGSGVYRIEIAEVRAGTNTEWQEACVSELRVMGRSAAATPGERYPRIGLGALPAPRTAPAPAELAARLQGERAAIVDGFAALEGWYREVDASPAAEVDAGQYRRLARLRRTALERILQLADGLDDPRIDAVRRRAALDVRPLHAREPFAAMAGHGASARTDVDVVAAALAAVRDAIGTDEGRCAWAALEVTLRVDRIAASLDGLWYTVDTLHSSDFEEERDLAEEYAGVDGANHRFEQLRASWHRDPRGTIERLRGADVPDAVQHLAADETAMRAALDTYAACPE